MPLEDIKTAVVPDSVLRFSSVPSCVSCFCLFFQAKLKVTSVSYNAVIAALFQEEQHVSKHTHVHRIDRRARLPAVWYALRLGVSPNTRKPFRTVTFLATAGRLPRS